MMNKLTNPHLTEQLEVNGDVYHIRAIPAGVFRALAQAQDGAITRKVMLTISSAEEWRQLGEDEQMRRFVEAAHSPEIELIGLRGLVKFGVAKIDKSDGTVIYGSRTNGLEDHIVDTLDPVAFGAICDCVSDANRISDDEKKSGRTPPSTPSDNDGHVQMPHAKQKLEDEAEVAPGNVSKP